jgi:NitT/TauT family transport system permease protein
MHETAERIGREAAASARAWGGSLDYLRAFLEEYAITIVAMIVGLVAWEVLVIALAVPRFILPTPSAILQALIRFWDILLFDTGVTLFETIVGFITGSLVGLILAIGIVFSRVLEKIIYPPAIVTQVVPKLAVAPLFVIWFGIGMLPKIMIGIVICLFPVLVNAVTGMRAVDPRMLDLMHSINASRWQIFWKVEFPNSAPHIFAGLKIGITLAVVGAIVGEWLGSNAGLGHQILMANSQLRSDILFAALFMLSVIGMGLFGLIGVLESLMLPRQRQIGVFDKLL